MASTVDNSAAHAADVNQEHQQHPLKTYFIVWGLLFVLSTGSYLVDVLEFHSYLRWSLILVFMMLKAGLIVAFFMHIKWERLALTYAVLLPPLAVLVFVAIMAFESDYTVLTRTEFFGATSPADVVLGEHTE